MGVAAYARVPLRRLYPLGVVLRVALVALVAVAPALLVKGSSSPAGSLLAGMGIFAAAYTLLALATRTITTRDVEGFRTWFVLPGRSVGQGRESR